MNSKRTNIGNSAIILTVSKMMTLMLTIVTSMMLSRYLSLEQYGTYSELLTVTSLAVSILSLGLPNCISYFVPQCKDINGKSEFINFYFGTTTVISAVIAILLFCFQGMLVDYYNNPQLALYSFFLIFIPWTKMLLSSRSNLLVVDEKTKKELIYSVANAVFLLGITVLLVLIRGSFKAYLYLYVAVEVIFTALVYYEAFISAGKKININLNFDLIKKVLIFSIPLGLSTAISTVSVDLDKLIIGWCMGETEVAIYANAGKELPFSYVSSSFMAVVLPQIVRLVKNNDINKAVALWKRSCEICTIILGFCAAASIVFAPQIITLLYSEKYLAGVGIFRIYSLVLLFRITYWGMILNAIGKTKEILYNSILCLILNLILSILFYKTIGFAGPALASCISIGFMSFIQLLRTSKVINIKIQNLFPWKEIAKTICVCGLSAVAVWVIVQLIDLKTRTTDIIVAVILGVVWAAIYFILSFRRIKNLWNSFNSIEKNT